jgi:hypothetical protein
MLKRFYAILLLSIVLTVFELQAQEVKITKLPFNDRFSNETFPCLIDSSLIFSSNRRVSALKNYTDENGNLLYHLFTVNLKPDSSWTRPKYWNTVVNSVFNNGQVWFADNGNTIFITKNIYDKYRKVRGKKGNSIGIFMSTKDASGNWSAPQPLPVNSAGNYNTGQPTLSPDGKYLFFVSDMNNGYGKTDIFVSENVNGTWSTPKNLGKKINTPGAEITPYFHPSGRLYFASDGLGGSGGFDIFYTIRTSEGWTDPVNIGEPYNSTGNDYAYFIASPADWGFFSSDRDGSDDIFRTDPKFPTFDKITPQKEIEYCGTLFEKKMMDKDTARFSFTWDMGDGTIKHGKKVHHCYPGPGKYHVILRVSDKKGAIKDDYITTYDLNIKQKVQVYISSPDTVKTNTPITFDSNRSYFGDFEPGDFYWNFGDGFKTKGRKVTYIFRKPGTYTISCGVISKTDPQKRLCNSKTIVVTE